jgi:peptide-methionine (S)-S-oxide reductase
MTHDPRPLEIATFAGGCFWCLEAVFERLRGVSRVVSGYAGGSVDRPTYREVCEGTTGHAETVTITFDPAAISYETLLKVFFAFHDPTTKDRQGPDVGTQYRSAVFAHTAEQAATARGVIEGLERDLVFDAPIVTEVTRLPASEVWPAETYHQGYFRSNPQQPYCQFQVVPKVAKLRRDYAELLAGS